MGIFGGSYPAGCEGTPFDEPCGCEVCGKDVDDCECPECPACGTHGDPKCYAEHGLTRPAATVDASTEWEALTRQTDDPKLAYLEGVLSDAGIPHKRTGWSYHAPILSVPKGRHDEAHALLIGPWDGEEAPETGEPESLDDVADDDPFFAEMFATGEARPHDFDGKDRTPCVVGD